jgi:hypothetical protein
MLVTLDGSRDSGSKQGSKETVQGREKGDSSAVAGVRAGNFIVWAYNGICA